MDDYLKRVLDAEDKHGFPSIGKAWGKLGNNEVDAVLEELRPFFEDANNYLGFYEGSAKKLCELKGWKRK